MQEDIVVLFYKVFFMKKSISYNYISISFFAVLVLVAIWLLYFYVTRKQLKHQQQTTVPATVHWSWRDARPAIWAQWLTDNQIAILHKTYESKEDIAIAKSLLQQYVTQVKFASAYDVLETIQKNKQLDQIPITIPWFIAFNYSIQENKKTMEVEWFFMSPSDKKLYQLLYLLQDKKYDEFSTTLDEVKMDEQLKDLDAIKLFSQSKQTYNTLKDPSAYYFMGLIAVNLMEMWYVPLAQNMAKDILTQDKNYILAYEILSQAAIKQQDYTWAINYLQVLMKLDTQHLVRTAFFLWKSYYNVGDYANALMYLNQVRDPLYIDDALRYVILTNYQQKQDVAMMDWFRYLLSEKKLLPSDYLLLFDIVFYEPYMKEWTGSNFALVQKYALQTIVPFIDSCRKNLVSTLPYVCKYWEAWRYLSQKKPEKALNDLLYVSKNYPHPTVFRALGDYYASIDDAKKADAYYTRALMSQTDAEMGR